MINTMRKALLSMKLNSRSIPSFPSRPLTIAARMLAIVSSVLSSTRSSPTSGGVYPKACDDMEASLNTTTDSAAKRGRRRRTYITLWTMLGSSRRGLVLPHSTSTRPWSHGSHLWLLGVCTTLFCSLLYCNSAACVRLLHW